MIRRKGFTLIELLVVIAIIGILSSIVLASLNTARDKGGDAKVKSQLASFREEAALYYDTNADYGADVVGNEVSDGTHFGNGCSDGFFVDSTVEKYTLPANYPGGTDIKCTASASTFVMSANLKNAGEFWCVDHAGQSKLTGAFHIDDATECP